MAAREPIANIHEGAIGRRRIVGRDEYGNDISEAVPARLGELMLDRDGTEVHVPLQNGRAPTRLSAEKYAPRLKQDVIRDGYVPKRECPMTMHYAHITNGPLATFAEKDFETVPREQCSIDPSSPPAHGCPHYQLLKKKRRQRSATQAESRKAPYRRGEPPTQAMLDMAKSMESMVASMSGASSVQARRQSAAELTAEALGAEPDGEIEAATDD